MLLRMGVFAHLLVDEAPSMGPDHLLRLNHGAADFEHINVSTRLQAGKEGPRLWHEEVSNVGKTSAVAGRGV